MEIEKDGMLPFLGTQLLNRAPQVETKVYVKPTKTGLLVHYQSHVDNRYKRSLLTTMLDRACRLPSSWLYFSEECERCTDMGVCETKSQLVNQQCVVYQFKCNLCDTGSYAGYTLGHLYSRVGGHKSTSASVRKHYDNDHAGAVLEDLLSCFKVLQKWINKFDCLVNEMLYIKQLTPSLNVQADSIRAKVFV